MPVACNSVPLSRLLRTTSSRDFTISQINAELARDSRKLMLCDGEILINFLNDYSVVTDIGVIKARRGTTLLLSHSAGFLAVAVLSDRKNGSTEICLKNKSKVFLSAGQELQYSKTGRFLEDATGRRRVQLHRLSDGSVLKTSEISLLSLLQSNSVLKELRRAKQVKVLGGIHKIAAALMLVTQNHGPFVGE